MKNTLNNKDVYFIHSTRLLTPVQIEILIGKQNNTGLLLSCVVNIQQILQLQSVESLVDLYL